MIKSNYDQEFEALLNYLKLARCCDLTGYKRTSLMRRFQQRMELLKIDHYHQYLAYLKEQDEEFVLLLNTVLINVTTFFRDREAWDYLAENIIPQILAGKEQNEPIRIWSAACASGEEAYTLVMILAEILGTKQFLQRVKIFATDVDQEALKQARQASYSSTQVMGIPPALLQKYFKQIEEHYIFDQKLRQAVIFGYPNLIQDAPISRIDLLVCRNALMYFTAEAQTRILVRFHFALNQKGFLFLGNAETLFTLSGNMFTPVAIKQRVFTKIPTLSRQEHLLLGTTQRLVKS